jgi:hypothetical protein
MKCRFHWLSKPLQTQMESQTYFHLHATPFMFSLATTVREKEFDHFIFMNTITMGQTYLAKTGMACFLHFSTNRTNYILYTTYNICKCTHTPSPSKYSDTLVKIYCEMGNPNLQFSHRVTDRIFTSYKNEVIGFFNWPNPSSCIMGLRSTQPLREMSTRNLPGGKGCPVLKPNNLTTICEPTV